MRRVIVALAAVCLAVAPPAVEAQDLENGERLYGAWCAECHGAEGAGDGPAAEYMLPRPRDFTAARYQIRTTGSGELPTDDDILHAIREGLPGTTMPGWPDFSRRGQEDLVAYLKSLSPFFEAGAPEPMDFGRDPGGGGDALERGRAAWETLECGRCHGEAGRGDGSSAPTLEDWRGLPAPAADLTEAWTFNGGTRVEDIHRRILTGLDGTPMPAAIDALQGGVVTEDEVWYLAHYVSRLGPRARPPVREVVQVARTEGQVPADPEDPAWDEAEPFWFPLAGQIVESPRQFAPAVDGVWVEGIHDGSTLALRLSWNDRSQSPDPAWTEWQERVADAVFADGVEIPTEPLPDVLAVQFPLTMPEGAQRPYFLMGDDRRPVYLWWWESTSGVREARATGLGRVQVLEGAGVEAAASFADGRWRVVLRRAVESGDANVLGFEEGRAIPVAFHAWDGSSGETGTRGAVSGWYFVYLEGPTSRAVVVAPLLTVLLTGGLGVALVRVARRRSGARGPRGAGA